LSGFCNLINRISPCRIWGIPLAWTRALRTVLRSSSQQVGFSPAPVAENAVGDRAAIPGEAMHDRAREPGALIGRKTGR
jgi:hypothetical protein